MYSANSSEILILEKSQKIRYHLIKEVWMDWKKYKDKAVSFSKDSVATLTALSSEVTTQIADATWFRSLNEFTSEVSKSMVANKGLTRHEK